jgi:DNA (cytosine-5)-methyltransferase 1
MAPPYTDPNLTSLSVFSGLGGLDLGLELAGFKSLGCIEANLHARESLALNRPEWKLIEPHEVRKAAKQLTPESLGIGPRDLAILCGGPPCQPFSKAAQWSAASRRGMSDSRAKCLWGFFRLAGTFLPRVILIENVQGFVSGKTSALPTLNSALKKINKTHHVNYRFQHWIVNAADYGIPQRRARAILIAERGGAELIIPPPSHAKCHVTAWDAIGEISSAREQPAIARHWLELLPTIPEGQNYLWHTRHGGGEPLFGYRTRFWSFLLKLAKNQPAWTLPAQPGPFTGPFHWDNRPLTIEEMLRLQSFPRSWIVAGGIREQIRQVGNATPPLLAEIIGRFIKSSIFGCEDSVSPKLSILKTKSAPPSPATTAPVPGKFLKLVRDWPDHPGAGRGPRPLLALRDSNDNKKSIKGGQVKRCGRQGKGRVA